MNRQVRYALGLPTHRVAQPDGFATAGAIAQITREAAASGFDAVCVTDHPAPDSRWLDNGGHHALDPFVALSFAAAAAPEIKLLTNVYVAAYRNPFLGAKLVQSLDVLSNGRLILGVAAGYLKPEFAALGIDFERRGALLDDSLEVLDALLSGNDVARERANYNARGVRLRPRTASGGRPPVWVGGNSAPAQRRAARYEGWAPFYTGDFARASRTAQMRALDDLNAGIVKMRALLPGAKAASFDICWSDPAVGDISASVDERRSRVTALSEMGVTWVTVSIPAHEPARFVAEIGAFGREIIAQH